MNSRAENPFADLTFESFRRLAGDPGLSKYGRIGFPDSYREGHEEAIFADLRAKLPRLEEPGRTVLDIGPGCSDLPAMLIELCRQRSHHLLLADSDEMLAHLPDHEFVTKVAGRFPDTAAALTAAVGGVDVIICYSVLQYAFADGHHLAFFDAALGLLAPGGEMLIGDIPNISKRQRFFASAAGQAFHRRITGQHEVPSEAMTETQEGKINDDIVLALLARARAAGCDAYLVPQGASLPMANRREDVIIRKP